MNKREKILVSLTVIVAIGAGVYMLLGRLSGPSTAPSPAGSKQAASTQNIKDLLPTKAQAPGSGNASSSRLSPYETRLLQAASKPWPKGVFQPAAPTVEAEHPVRDLHYSGYMQTNGTSLAIINELPFARGDSLQGTARERCTLQSINPRSVVIRTPEGEEITVPLQPGRSDFISKTPETAGPAS